MSSPYIALGWEQGDNVVAICVGSRSYKFLLPRGGPLNPFMRMKFRQRVCASSHKGCELPSACQAAMSDSRALEALNKGTAGDVDGCLRFFACLV